MQTSINVQEENIQTTMIELNEDFSNALDVLRCLLNREHYSIIYEIDRIYKLTVSLNR